MKTQSSLTIAFLLTLLVTTTQGDEIHFKNGQFIKGKVLDFKDGKITIRKEDGKTVSGDIGKIDQIRFDDSSSVEAGNEAGDGGVPKQAVLTPAIRGKIAKAIEEAKQTLKENQAIVVMYLDTPKPTDELPRGFVGYRCFYKNGYSGDVSIPFIRQAWTRNEYLHPGQSGPRTIKLDPGPPYENLEFEVELTAGEVTNLGRVMLKKVEATGTANISGIVKDLEGNPVPDAIVTAGSKNTKSGTNGEYSLEGFGLSDLSIEAAKKGYFCLPSKVSIRNMENRSIESDVGLFRPMNLRFEFVISAPGSTSFEGPGVEKGEVELKVSSTDVDLSTIAHSSKSFETFAKESRLACSMFPGDLRFRTGMGPVFFQPVGLGSEFESIKEAGEVDSQREVGYRQWPVLEQGAMFIVRGFRKPGEYAVSKFCLKIKVTELTIE